MTEVLSGIFQLKIPIPNNPLGFTNIYLLRGDDGYLMIDAGSNEDESMDAMKRQLSETGVEPEEISTIIITHAHGDHIGLAGQLRELSGAKVAMHHLEMEHFSPALRRSMMRSTEDWFRSNGVPDNPPAEMGHPGMRGGGRRFSPPAAPDITLEDNQELNFNGLNLRVLWTPGHSPGLICLYDATRRVLFSADHILPVTTPNIGLRPGTSSSNLESNPLGEYLNSLARVRDLDVGVVFPAHEQIFNDLSGRVDEITEHHHHRNEEIIGTLKSSSKTAYQISEQITWMPETEGGVKFHDLAHWNQRMAVSETIAHLQALRNTGTIKRYGDNGVVYYQLTPDS